MVVNWKKFKNKKVEQENNFLQLWHQRPLCKRLSQEETILKNQIQRFLTSTSKTKLLVIAFFIYEIFRDAWFVDFGASQHLTFQKEVFSTFEEFTWSHKIYLEDNNMLDVCGKDIVFNLLNEISRCIGDMLYIPKFEFFLLLIS